MLGATRTFDKRHDEPRAGGNDLAVASIVGSGDAVACEDTVPFCCWCAAHENTHFSEAMWLTVAGLGDRDTNCAIVGGIVGAKLEVPDEWTRRREALPEI